MSIPIYTPNPDFYAALLFHHLMGDAVYTSQVHIESGNINQNQIHAYVHNDGSTGSTASVVLPILGCLILTKSIPFIDCLNN